MAKDDYDVIVYKILVYLYGCLKGKISFDKTTFEKTVGKENVSDEYFARIIYMMQSEGFIRYATFTQAWGNIRILLTDPCDLEITADGIHYIKENDIMQKIKDHLMLVPGLVSELMKLVM